jgi:CheY-like chemotaxis protein
VEDNRINQIVAQQLLKRADLEVEVASSAQEALEILSDREFGVVLMDVQMPGMDGIEATRIIRDGESSVRQHDIPVIAMTAYTAPEDQKACFDAGMNDYVSKPLDMDSFLAKIRKHLDGEDRLFDYEGFIERLGGDRELAGEVVEGFFADFDGILEAAGDALEDGDSRELRARAHRLAGSLANISALPLRDLAIEIEKAAMENDLESARARFDEFRDRAKKLRSELSAAGFVVGEGENG